jgi:rhomboid protease GluP
MIVLYIICCTQGIDKSKDVLAIAPNILIKFGAMQDILLANGEVYRLLSASFLHMNLLHITMNLISFVFLLSRLEKIFNVLFIIGILLGSSIAGIPFLII